MGQEGDALPGDGGVHHDHREFAREFVRDMRRQQKCLAILLEDDDRHRHPIFFARMNTNKKLRIWFLQRHFRQKLFNAGAFYERLIKPHLLRSNGSGGAGVELASST